jgi:lantibiotic modifying enzyme
MYGSAGIGLFLLYAAKEISYPKAMAIAAGHRLVETAITTDKGIKWLMSPQDSARQFYMPNFSHGTAGVCYFLARLYEETGEKKS